MPTPRVGPPAATFDAELEVVSAGRPQPRRSAWTFWGDDFPAALEIVASFAVAVGVWALFRAIHWLG